MEQPVPPPTWLKNLIFVMKHEDNHWQSLCVADLGPKDNLQLYVQPKPCSTCKYLVDLFKWAKTQETQKLWFYHVELIEKKYAPALSSGGSKNDHDSSSSEESGSDDSEEEEETRSKKKKSKTPEKQSGCHVFVYRQEGQAEYFQPIDIRTEAERIRDLKKQRQQQMANKKKTKKTQQHNEEDQQEKKPTRKKQEKEEDEEKTKNREETKMRIESKRIKDLFFVKATHPLAHQSVAMESYKTMFLSSHQNSLPSKIPPRLLYWSMGSGKTKGAKLIISMFPQVRELIVVCPKTILSQWIEVMEEIPQWSGQTWVRIMGYQEFHKHCSKHASFLENKWVILDESHNYRNATESMEIPLRALTKAVHVLFLSGTPLVNSIEELPNFLAMMQCEDKDIDWVEQRLQQQQHAFASSSSNSALGKKKSHKSNMETEAAMMEKKSCQDWIKWASQVDQELCNRITHMLKGRVFYYNPEEDRAYRSHFPTMDFVTLEVPLSLPQAWMYLCKTKKSIVIAGNEYVFHRGNRYQCHTRMICNSHNGISPKRDKMIQFLQEHQPFPCLVYSGFIENGLNLLTDNLDPSQCPWRFREMDGSTKGSHRTLYMKEFNSKKLDVFFVSKAGKQSMDLLGGRCVALMEPSENLATERQIINRLSRYDSHKKEPAAKRRVTVLRLISTFPVDLKTTTNEEEKQELDRILTDLINPEPMTSAIREEAIRFIHQNTNNQATVEEIIFYRNIAKQKQLNPILHAIQLSAG